nr:putative reverse transcriptase domain-containing protein [Tanacetum cinerariifolium]
MTITRYGMTHEAIKEIITRQVAEALDEQEANRTLGPIVESESENGDDNENGINGGRGNDRNGNGGNSNGGRNENNKNNNGNEDHGDEVQIDDKLHFIEEPVEIMDREGFNFISNQSSFGFLMAYRRSREDETCNEYGNVVDAFIPNIRSKAGKRFGFVRFVMVFDVDRFVTNLCTIWVNRYKLLANKARFQRPPQKNSNVQYPKKGADKPVKNVKDIGDHDEIQIDDKLHFIEEPVEIMDREVKRLKQSRIPIVKFRWSSRRGPEFTWEREDQFQKKYPHLFSKPITAPDDTI